MPRTNEVMGIVEAADTAVWTAAILDLVEESRPLPPDADKVLDQAIAMLDDALKGSALLTGKGDAQGFSGSLDAYSWATDSCIAECPESSPTRNPDAFHGLLTLIHQQISEILNRIKTQSPMVSGNLSFKDAKRFFDTLARILAQRASASLTHPSRAHTLAALP